MKNVFRKAFALILVLALIAGLSCSAFAAANLCIEAGNVTADANAKTVEVPVTVTSNPGIAGLVFSVSYDTSVLTLKSWTSQGKIFPKDMIFANLEVTPVTFTTFAAQDMTATGEFVTLCFEIKAGSQPGKYPVYLYPDPDCTATNFDGDDIQATLNHGSVTIPGTSGGSTSSVVVSGETVAVPEITIAMKDDASATRYMKGYLDNTFKPDRAASRYEVVEALAELFTVKSSVPASALKDVSEYYAKVVADFTAAGILSGYPDGTFRGDKGITRAELVKILSVMLGVKTEGAESSALTDISAHWAKDYINAFVKTEYVKGYPDGTFRPDKNVTRAEFVTIINRIIGAKSETGNPAYSDLSENHWAYADILKAGK